MAFQQLVSDAVPIIELAMKTFALMTGALVESSMTRPVILTLDVSCAMPEDQSIAINQISMTREVDPLCIFIAI